MSGHHDDSEGYDRRRCDARYQRPGGHQRGDRIVECHLPAGHPGEHEEADTEVTWTNDDERGPMLGARDGDDGMPEGRDPDDRRPAAEAGRADDEPCCIVADIGERVAAMPTLPGTLLHAALSSASAGRADDDGGDVYQAAGRAYVLAVNPSRPLDETWAQDLANDHALRAAIDAARAPLLARIAKQAEALELAVVMHEQGMAEVTRERDEALGVLAKFADDDPCHFDHHGNCQAHRLDPPPCSVAEAKRLTRHAKPVTDDGDAP